MLFKSIEFRLSNSICALALLLGVAGPAWCQSEPSEALQLNAGTSVLRRYEPDTWSSMAVHGTNKGDVDAEGLMVVYFEDDSGQQYARRMWVPAKSIRHTWLPVRIPNSVNPERANIRFSSMQLEQTAAGEVVRRENNEPVIKEDAAVLDRDHIKTATSYRPQVFDYVTTESLGDDEAYDMIVLSRLTSSLPRVTIDLEADFLPPSPVMLDALDQIVVAGDRLAHDSAGLLSVQDWLRSGGRMWIMVDRVSPETIERLFGHAACFEIVDRVELTDFTLVDRASRSEQVRSSEAPVELVRVVTDAAEIHCEIDGWPAAFWQPYGDGEVLFTTLSPLGWAEPKVPGVEYVPMEAFTTVSSRLYLPRNPMRLDVAEIQPILQERIGYSIPSRAVATGLLGLNCVALLIAGILLGRFHRLEHLAWLVPGICVTVAGVLLAVGMSNSRSVPPTLAAMELVSTNAHSVDAFVSGVGAVYSQDAAELDFKASPFGLVEPQISETAVQTKRLEWDDDGASKWVRLETAPGSVRMLQYNQRRQLDAPVAARGQFGPNGLEGRLEVPDAEAFTELLITAPPSPNIAVRLREDGTFSAGNAEILSRDQYLTDTILSDEQRRRQSIYRELLNPRDDLFFPRMPTLFGWQYTEGPQLGLPAAFQQRAASLTSIPVQFTRTPPDTEFLVPAAFVRIESYLGAHGSSSVFNPRTGLWMEDVMRPTNTELRFRLPDSILPCALSRAEMTIKINAPSRTVQISRVTSGEPVVLETFSNPSGVVSVTIDDPADLEQLQPGSLLLGISVSKSTRQIDIEEKGLDRSFVPERREDSARNMTFVDNSTWEIDYVRLNVSGKTLVE